MHTSSMQSRFVVTLSDINSLTEAMPFWMVAPSEASACWTALAKSVRNEVSVDDAISASVPSENPVFTNTEIFGVLVLLFPACPPELCDGWELVEGEVLVEEGWIPASVGMTEGYASSAMPMDVPGTSCFTATPGVEVERVSGS